MATGTSNESVVAKYRSAIRDGDHLFVRRFTWWQDRQADEKGVVKYTYSHHGIYDAVNDRVIAFGEPRKEKPPSPTKEGRHRALFLPGTKRIVERTRKIALDSMTALSTFYSSKIIYQSPEDSYSRGPKSNPTYLVYLYTGVRGDGDDASVELAVDKSTVDGISPDYARNASAASKSQRSRAGDVARWFVANQPTIFGKYGFRKCNCEHFATLCKTFAGSNDQLAAICRDEATDGVVPMKVWRRYSKARSLQVERYIRGDTRFRSKIGDDSIVVIPDHADYDHLDGERRDIMDHESDDDGDVHDGPAGDANHAPVGDVNVHDGPAGDANHAPVGDVNGDVNDAPVGDVNDTPVGDVNDAPVSDEQEGADSEATVNVDD